MLKNLHKGEFGLEGTVSFNRFGVDILVLIEDGVDIPYAEQCVAALNSLCETTIDLLCKYSEKYCRDFCESVGEECPEINTPRDILQYIYPLALIVDKPQDSDVVVHLELNCEWEPEHGMEWIIKGKEILYVGSFNGESAYEERSYYEMCGNYVYDNV